MRALAATLAFTAALLTAPRSAFGQERGAAALDQLVRGLPVSARVLMVGAHPDDEDTNLLAWLEKEHQVHAAYLSLTRGDGGQNLIGNDLGEALGAIRTEELLAARRIDGAEQYFTRAYDFGFSKNADETFRQWDREQLLGDVVRVMRAFRPHVVVAVFSGTPTDGHGHHQASGILAREAYDHAGDTVRFPVATHGRPWEPAKFYRGAWSRNAPATMTVQVGGYDPVLGRSPAEIAGESRSQHRSQGFGALQARGVVQTRLTREASRVNGSVPATDERSIFDGVDTSFARFAREMPSSGPVFALADSLMRTVAAQLDLREPHRIVRPLARLVNLLDLAAELDGSPDFTASMPRLRARAKAALLEAAGIAVEATASRELVAFGDSIPVRIRVYNRGRDSITVTSVSGGGLSPIGTARVAVPPDSTATFDRFVQGVPDLRPWWIGGRQAAMFAFAESPVDGLARVAAPGAIDLVPSVMLAEETRRVTDVLVHLYISTIGTDVSTGPITWRFADPVLGEQHRPVGGVPAVTVRLDRGLEYAPAGRPLDRQVRATVTSHTDVPRTLTPRVLTPDGLRATGLPDSITLGPRETREVSVTLEGQLSEGRHEFGIGFMSQGVVYSEGFRTIEYPHIRPQRLFRDSGMFLQAVSITVPRDLRVVYVAGVSDVSAAALQQVGVQVLTVSAAELPNVDLSRFTTVVIGPRAYDAFPELRAQNQRLLAWVNDGGTLLVQYGQFEMAQPGMTPFPIGFTRPAARVTLEDAEVRVLDPQSRLLQWPNRITAEDWEGWVQERALYMPSEIDARYRTPLAMNDPGEPENRGAILEATAGRGRYVYTSLSLFRQVPAGVPGGIRLLVNLLSAGIQTR